MNTLIELLAGSVGIKLAGIIASSIVFYFVFKTVKFVVKVVFYLLIFALVIYFGKDFFVQLF